MGLESGNYISDLDEANPTSSDIKGLGDNHLRLIKHVLRYQFPNFTAAPVTLTIAQLNDVINKASLTSPAFLGTPTAPTAVIGTNTTQLATTAFVMTAVGSGTTPAGPGDYGVWFWNGSAYSWSVGIPLLRVARSSNTILGPDDLGKQIDLSGGFTQTVTAAATLGATWRVVLNNAGGHDQPIDPNGTETIDGQALYTLKAGWRIELVCDGANFSTNVLKRRTYTTLAQVTSTTVVTIPADTYVFKPYAFGQGGNGVAGTSSGGGGGCAYGDIPCIPGQQFTLSVAAGVAKVSSGGIDYLTANPAAGTVAGTASKHASVQNGGAFSGGTGSATSSYGGASSGSPLGTGVSAGTNSGGAGWGGAGSTTGNGGGSGGAATADRGGPAVSASIPSVEPLLATLNGVSGIRISSVGSQSTAGTPGGRGAGGGAGFSSSGLAGEGGFGGGGGAGQSSGNNAAGGFGGGGGGGGTTGAAGGLGGGGGGAGSSAPGVGGAAAILYWMGD